jgi:hypothetical protein
MMDWARLATAIWHGVDPNIEFPGARSEKEWTNSVKSLSRLLPREDWNAIYPYTPKAMANRQLREHVSPYLTGHDGELRAKLARWIITDWGGIKRGADKIPGWSERLGDYSPERVDAFVDEMDNRRVSSWSKMLSFARPNTDAVYDARTAVALNCILFNMGCRVGFRMPSSQNTHIKPVQRSLARSMEARFGYRDYISLLGAIVETTEASNLLQVEMALFSNAPTIAAAFAKPPLAPRLP